MTESRRRAVMRMRWRHLLFMHWRVDPGVLRPLVPEGLEIDTFDGSAWVGLIPFTMEDVSPVCLPRVPLRGLTDFHECNVRTYVRPRIGSGDLGVWFFSLDAASRPAVWGARRFWNLPYFFARMDLSRENDRIDYAVDRIDAQRSAHGGISEQPRLRCSWRALDPLPRSNPGELAHFLTERYSLYSEDRRGGLHRGRIGHQPWPLRSAELISLDDSLVRAAGIDVDQSQLPVLHHADLLNVSAWMLEQV